MSSLSAPIFFLLPASPDAMGQSYEIVSIQRVGPPPDGKGSNWHRYEIAFNDTNTICGYRQGSIKDVIKEVEEIVAQLNKRVGTNAIETT